MNAIQRIGHLVGVRGDRTLTPPQYVAVADGLIVTDRSAEAWFALDSSNTDLMAEDARDAELDQAARAFARILAGYDCHLRALWVPLRAEDYLAEAESLFAAGYYREWAAARVDRLEDLELPVRHLLLGVRIADRSSAAQAAGRRGVREALGLGSSSVARRELSKLTAQMNRLGRQLEHTPWRAQAAPVETLAWMIAREQHRDTALPVPAAGVIAGAKVATLTRGRVLPYPDHLKFVDVRGRTTAWASVLTMTGFPEEMESPGFGEWLRVVAEINYVRDNSADGPDDDSELITPVNPEISLRFRPLPKREALKRVEEARKLAKEQRTSAARHSAEEAGRDIEEAEDVMADLARDMKRDDVTLVEDHPRLVVASTKSLEDLRARVDAVVTFYGGIGIEVSVGEEEQRDLWLESQPGDQLRVPDLGHVRDVTALAGSWFWGGARVGDDSGPIGGYLTGSTSGIFRTDVTAGSERGDATTTALIGRSGRGKTTALMLMLLDAAFRGSLCLALDFKGDLGGLALAGRRYGLNAHVIETGAAFAGACDLFALLDSEGSERARIEVPAQLGIAIPGHLRDRGAETPIQHAVNAVIDAGNPATWKVIDYLRASRDDLARETGEALHELAQTPIGTPFMGVPSGASPLTPGPGIWVIQIPGVSLPTPDLDRDDWTSVQRLSVALMHSMLAYAVTIAGRRDLRTMRKVVAVPEVHVLTATREGAGFLNYIARVGRALSTALVVDTQDPESLLQLTGVIEQLTTVIGFQLTTRDQQDALAELLYLPKHSHTRQLIRAIGLQPDGEIRHGHSIVRDRRFRAATVQWDVPTAELLTLLDTSPNAAHQSGDVPETDPWAKGGAS
jgi:hypothetical protein